MFEGFETRDADTAGARIHLRVGGSGPPLLLLHGYPQTHLMWHRVAPALAQRFTVVCPDLRGYGDSGKPASDPEHRVYSKRASAQDMVEVMAALGHQRFGLAGHDRGGRVAHRLALDHPERALKLAVLDIVPTWTIFRATDQVIATGYFHWFFLIQPGGLPEHTIGADLGPPLDWLLGRWGTGLAAFAPEALAEYERCFQRPAGFYATCAGLPRRRHHRPRPRRGRSSLPKDCLPGGGALGPARPDGAPFRRARDLAQAGRGPGLRPRPRLRPFFARGTPAGDRGGQPARLLRPAQERRRRCRERAPPAHDGSS